MANERSYTAGKFAFTLDGTPLGFLQSFDGGNMNSELATHKMGPSNCEMKNITTIKWTPIKMRTGMGMSKGLYTWIQSAFEMACQYKTGACVVADFNYKAQRRMDIQDMLMTKVTLPTLSGDSKETGYFDIEVLPTQCRWFKESGYDVRGPIGTIQKGWHCANWQLDIKGLPCDKAAKIEGIAWECKTVMDACGKPRENTIHPVATTVTDWTAHISLADLGPWEQKAKQWFVDGKCLSGDELEAAIILNGPDGAEFGRVELMGVGMKEFNAHGKLEGQTENVARFTVKFYTEQMKLTLAKTDA